MSFPTQTPLLAPLLMTLERPKHAGASINQILLLIPESTLMVHSKYEYCGTWKNYFEITNFMQQRP